MVECDSDNDRIGCHALRCCAVLGKQKKRCVKFNIWDNDNKNMQASKQASKQASNK